MYISHKCIDPNNSNFGFPMVNWSGLRSNACYLSTILRYLKPHRFACVGRIHNLYSGKPMCPLVNCFPYGLYLCIVKYCKVSYNHIASVRMIYNSYLEMLKSLSSCCSLWLKSKPDYLQNLVVIRLILVLAFRQSNQYLLIQQQHECCEFRRPWNCLLYAGAFKAFNVWIQWQLLAK